MLSCIRQSSQRRPEARGRDTLPCNASLPLGSHEHTAVPGPHALSWRLKKAFMKESTARSTVNSPDVCVPVPQVSSWRRTSL